MDVQPVAVELIALACVEGSRLAAEHAGIQIQFDLPSDLPMVYGDSTLLGQVFDNLLDNAIKFSPDGGVITVRLYRRISVVEIAISDTGIGMPADCWSIPGSASIKSTAHRRAGFRASGLADCQADYRRP